MTITAVDGQKTGLPAGSNRTSLLQRDPGRAFLMRSNALGSESDSIISVIYIGWKFPGWKL